MMGRSNGMSKKNGIIMYQSKYGATAKYARWLREMTGFGCVETKKVSLDEVMRHSFRIYNLEIFC